MQLAPLITSEQKEKSCPKCGSACRVGHKCCLNCLLGIGLSTDTLDDEDFQSSLDKFAAENSDWLLGNYQILEEIGRGGMGVIYRARHVVTGQILALKRILSHHSDSKETVLRFRREAEMAFSLHHRNILPIYDIRDDEDGLPFFTMKFAGGGSLLDRRDILKDHPRLSVALMAKVSHAVEFAHTHGVLHRDLKPGNILLNGYGEPLVSDFGLAKWLDASDDLSRTLTIFGTAGYIAPEQANGSRLAVNTTVDVYSLGAILFDLLAGRPPFIGEHALAVIQQATEKPPAKLRSVAPESDRDLEAICGRCLEREPSARYPSARDLALDLERWLNGRPVSAKSRSPLIIMWRRVKRNPKLAASVGGYFAGAVALLMLAAIPLLTKTQYASAWSPSLEKSVAVLPFENVDQTEWGLSLANGVQDEILNDLAKVADLKVISHGSITPYTQAGTRNLAQIAKDLSVTYVVEGSVQRTGEHVRITVALIHARSGTHLSTLGYDCDLAHIFAVESGLAEQIATKLRAKLLPEEKKIIEQPPARSFETFALYLRARNLLDTIAFGADAKKNLAEANHLLHDAINGDPSFLLAYCQLARANDLIYFLGIDHTQERIDLADAAVHNALRLWPESGEAHLALAQHLYWSSRNYDQAAKELSIARSRLPNEPLSLLLAAYIDRRQGRWNESTAELREALKLDPQNIFILQVLSANYQFLHAYKDMQAILDRIVSLNQNDVTVRAQRASVDLLYRAETLPLHLIIESAARKEPTTLASMSEEWIFLALCERDKLAAKRALGALPVGGCSEDSVRFPDAWCEGVVERFCGDENAAHDAFSRARAEAEQVVRQQPDYPEALSALSMIYAAIGRKNDAIQTAQRAVELLPVSKDSLTGVRLLHYLAIVYAITGEERMAVDELTRLAAMPSDVSYGELRLHPYWDSLRNDPRFENLMTSLAADKASLGH